MAFSLTSVLKALLFSSGQPLSIKDIQAVFTRYHERQEGLPEGGGAPDAYPSNQRAGENPGQPEANDIPKLVTASEIREAMKSLARQLHESRDIYRLDEGAKGYRIVSHPEYAAWIRALRQEPPPVKLSAASLETLAVIAYRQPVTRSEIEAVRGVSADAGLSRLLERELIFITGRAELPGRPLQYGTTDRFLEFVGVKSLVELPSSDVLSPRQIDEWLKDAMNPTTPGDAQMGLPLEEGEGDTPMQDEAHIEVVSEAGSATIPPSGETDGEPPEQDRDSATPSAAMTDLAPKSIASSSGSPAGDETGDDNSAPAQP